MFNPCAHAHEAAGTRHAPRTSMACAEAALAWSSDGSTLYRLGHERDVLVDSRRAMTFEFRADLAAVFSERKLERPLYALDVATHHASPLRLAAAYGQPGNGADAADLVWRTQSWPGQGSRQYTGHMDTQLNDTGGVSGGEACEAADRDKTWRRGFLRCGVGATTAGVAAGEACTLTRDPRDGHLVVWSDSLMCAIPV